jgi:hypothetical protein
MMVTVAQELQRNGNRGRDDHELERDLAEPMAGKRGLGVVHGVSLSSSFLDAWAEGGHRPSA